ncbi:MAG: DctP family TRAP transporter solute-binding subunit [Desulfovibrio sp.]|jgi:tripartite ATP-independent transporter DctP family solute receptor|nr:DctP family TRAP transporter solute-binding subunit [Desulfovibrio sp.]
MAFSKKFMTVLAAAALVVFMAQGAFAAKSIKLHHINPNENFGNPSGASALVFKNLVESGSNGAITVEIFPNSQLGKDNEVLQQVKSGIIQMGIHSTGGLASVYPMISVLDIPFGFPNHAAAYKVLDGPFGKKLAADISAKTGMQCLGFNDSGGFFQISNSKHAIKSAGDMKGLKIRTMSLPTHQSFVSSLGGQPVAISWSEVYTALQTGVADGQMNPIPIVEFAKLYEVQKYLTITNHLFAPQMWMVNQKFWDSLNDEEKVLIKSSVYAAITTSRGIANAIEASDRGLPFLKKKMEVNSLSSEAKAEMSKIAVPAARAIIEKTFGDEGKALLNEFLAAVAEAGK